MSIVMATISARSRVICVHRLSAPRVRVSNAGSRRACVDHLEDEFMSTKEAGPRAGAATIDTADRPEKIRNVALVGHSGAGKTTLVEALLVATGEISRAGTIPDGTTVSDHDPVEVAQQRSVALSVCPVRYGADGDDVVINLLDTPGYPDFTGEPV